MKKNYIFFVIFTMLSVISCSTNQNYQSKQSVKDYSSGKALPKMVAVYQKNQLPHAAYRVIGTANISKHNLLGFERDETTINNMMKKFAASIGGDALIDIKNNRDVVEAQVIQFQKVM